MTIFADSWDEVDRLRALGLTDHAITVYLLNVHRGRPADSALDMLLRGRTLNEDQTELIRNLLHCLYIRLTSPKAAASGA